MNECMNRLDLIQSPTLPRKTSCGAREKRSEDDVGQHWLDACSCSTTTTTEW